MSREKLVRDRIPELLTSVHRSRSTRRSAESDRQYWLLEKLHEEAAEVSENLCVEELADVLEVLRALAEEIESPWEDVERERVKKREERGAFREGWLLTLPDVEPQR